MIVTAEKQGGYGTWRKYEPAPDEVLPLDQSAGLCCYEMNLKYSHPLWNHYVLFAVHLRPIPGGTPAVLDSPGMTHQINVMALNPESSPVPPWQWLSPPNVQFQLAVQDAFENNADVRVKWITELFADACVISGFPVEDGGRSLSMYWQETARKTLDCQEKHI